jgi:hypothetical protein
VDAAALQTRLRRAGSDRSDSDSGSDSGYDNNPGHGSDGSSTGDSDDEDDGSAAEDSRRTGSKRARVQLNIEAQVALRRSLEDVEKKVKDARTTFGSLPIPSSQKKYKVFDFSCVSELGLIADSALVCAEATNEPAERADGLERAVDRLAEGLRLMQQAMVIGATDGWDRAVTYVSGKDVLAAACAPASTLLPADYKAKSSSSKRKKKGKKRQRGGDDKSESSDDSEHRPAKKRKVKKGERPAKTAAKAKPAKKKKTKSPKGKKAATPPAKPKKKSKKGKLKNKDGKTVTCWAVIDKKGTVCGQNHYRHECTRAYGSGSDEETDTSSASSSD